jgi:glycosyltransferase involved in cell wall biosynthesis
MRFSESLALGNSVTFHDEVPQQMLADNMRDSVALILYSDYETFGCVVIEANACGIPVIVSDIPVFHETVKEGVNGFFAEPRNSDALAERMMEIIKMRSSFDSNQISNMTAMKYSYPVIGKKITDWYQQVLKTN